jgi:DNA-binding CsgD family transcriptional regulator
MSPGSRPSISGTTAVALLELIDECVACEEEAALRERIFPRLRRLVPFDFACALLGCRNKGNEPIRVHGFLDVSLPEEFIRTYVARRYDYSDPVVLQNFAAPSLQRWSGVHGTHHVAGEGSARRLRMPGDMLSLFMDCGIRGGHTQGSRPRTPQEHASMFCFLGPSMKRDERVEAVLEHITPHLHLAFSRAMGEGGRTGEVPVLSSRETEILEWIEQGKSTWDVSAILGISERTVGFHVANVRRKLGACNRAQAVAIAIQFGLIRC